MNESVKRWACRLALVGASSLAALLSPNASPADTPEQGVAKAVSVQGTVEARRAGQTQWQPVKLNDSFRAGDSIRVGERSRADLQLLNQSVLRLNASSSITVEAPKEGRTGVVDLVRGAVHFFSRGPNSLEVKTPFTTAGVRGTEFFINLEPKATQLTVFEGTVVAQNAAGSLTLSGGQSAVAEAGKAPVTRIVARPRDAVHWALYYPPVIQDRQAPAYRAQTLLALGAVDEARSDIQRALVTAPNNADALSLQSIMTLVQGDKDGALKIAQGAVDAAPKSATARIARSYALQAGFDLPAARADVERAVELDPRNALAWARLAELHSSFGDLDKAMEAAQKAVALEPNLARTQTVLGFAHLTSINTKQARETFEKAIALDQADPLPRLGLGLAKIRDGELEAGSRDIEVAASLDPSNALVRSYLGKAYFEEKRTGLDEREYAVAKQLDPKDPTPWFYDAITKQTTNRPVEALQDLDKARELNDNRSVYRSQLLLDSDAAARAASQARIFSELGFQQRALVEGWQALNRDPTNFSAHRFLADSYAVLPNSEIARQSALLQSQLLQPINSNPVQPSLGDRSAVSPGTGPANLSFNEYTQLFNRNQVQLLASGIVGNHDTWGEELVAKGLYDRYSLSLGQFRYRTQGFRENADIDQTIYNGFIQVALTTQLSIQGEVRVNDTNEGDLGLRFYRDFFSPTLDVNTRIDTYRLGLHYAPTQTSDLIVSGFYQKNENETSDLTPYGFSPDTGYTSKGTTRARTIEGQYLFHVTQLSVTAGGGYYAGPTTSQISLVFFNPPSTLDFSQTEIHIRHSNFYLYSVIDFPVHIALTLGASFDQMTDQPLERKQFNPKLGLMWNPTPSTTFRMAGFRTMRRDLISNQTIEPTQVAGFQQFFQDFGADAVDSKEFGVGIDQKVSSTLSGGAELIRRRLMVPVPLYFSDGTVEFQDQEEKLKRGRAYLYLTPESWAAVSAEYFLDRTSGEYLNGSFTTLTTHQVPLGLNLYHPTGVVVKVGTTYVDQHGEFKTDPTGFDDAVEQGETRFWIWDASIGYRLPKRYGIFTIGADNLFDREFRLFDVEGSWAPLHHLPQYQPARFVFAKLTLSF